ncbi:MAG: OsmC family protein [Bacilli bacterium]|jgi:putative redox protein
MDTDTVVVKFDTHYVGTLESPTATVALGSQPNGAMPYHLLYGALASCFYSNFLSISKKKRLTFKDASITVSGIKREEMPATLKTVHIELAVTEPSNETGLRSAAELGIKYCSIHETIKQVAEITLDIKFIK